MEPILISLVGAAGTAILAAGIAFRRGSSWKAKALRAQGFHDKDAAALNSANAEVSRLQGELAIADRRFAERGDVIAGLNAELDQARVALARFNSAARPRQANGRFGGKA